MVALGLGVFEFWGFASDGLILPKRSLSWGVSEFWAWWRTGTEPAKAYWVQMPLLIHSKP
ncbi:unnamed protein product [Prunus armeniaca]|uniref:Uncharacterized protein n=1 Tax=Prunus armeniaca TaxID=36596 RepID=A0A6J5XWF2_PRUAR|nr:unnamed protein product [Prunus armeniaca]